MAAPWPEAPGRNVQQELMLTTGNSSGIPDNPATPLAETSPVSGAGRALRQMRAMVITNSLSAGAYQDQATLNGSVYGFGSGAIHQLNAMLGGAFVFDDTGDATNVLGTGKDLVQGFYCYGGAPSGSLTGSVLDFCLTAYRPEVVFGRLFENDVGGTTLAYSYAALVEFVSKVKAAGALPIVITCVPRPFFTSAAYRTHFDELFDLCYQYCAANGAICLDSSTQYLDHTNTYPVPLSGYADTGGIGGHPNPRGNLCLAKSWFAQLSGLINRVQRDVPGRMGGNQLLTVVTNPTMTGTGGTPAGAADGWTASAGAGSTITYLTTTSGLRTVPRFQVAFSGSAGGNTFMSYRQPTASTGFAVGDKIQFELDWELMAAPVGLKSVSAYIDMGGGKLLYATFMDSSVAGWNDQYPSGRMLTRSPIYAIPAGTTTLRMWIYVYVENAVTTGSVDIVFHSCTVRKLPLLTA